MYYRDYVFHDWSYAIECTAYWRGLPAKCRIFRDGVHWTLRVTNERRITDDWQAVA